MIRDIPVAENMAGAIGRRPPGGSCLRGQKKWVRSCSRGTLACQRESGEMLSRLWRNRWRGISTEKRDIKQQPAESASRKKLNHVMKDAQPSPLNCLRQGKSIRRKAS